MRDVLSSNERNKNSRLETKFFEECTKILINKNMIEWIELPKEARLSSRACRQVLNFIAKNTIPFHTVFEYTTRKEISTGIPKRYIAGTRLSLKTIQNALNLLYKEGFLIKHLEFVGSEVAWGLNLPFLLQQLSLIDIPNASLKRKVVSLRNAVKLERAFFSRFSFEGIDFYQRGNVSYARRKMPDKKLQQERSLPLLRFSKNSLSKNSAQGVAKEAKNLGC